MSCEFCGDGPCIVCGKGFEKLYRSAFPTFTNIESGNLFAEGDGMTLLDHLAGLAMQGIIAGRKEGGTYTTEKIARDAYGYARAMMQEREAQVNKPKPYTSAE